jgi:hypothetical protein
MSRHPRPDEEYISWGNIQDENIEPGETLGARDAEMKSLSAEFAAEERNKNLGESRREEILNELQLEVEREFHEEGNLVAYGILEDEIFPAFVMPSNDTVYADEEWFYEKAEEMLSPEYFLEDSKASNPEILEGMKIGMPEGLGKYAERVLERVDQVDQYDFTEANETYLMPKLSAEQYDRL